MPKFIPAKRRIDVSAGGIIRELQGLGQTQLSSLGGIPQTTISGIEPGWVNLGVERAKVLASRCTAIPSCWCFRVGSLSHVA